MGARKAVHMAENRDERGRNDTTTETGGAAIQPTRSVDAQEPGRSGSIEQQYKDVPAELKNMRQWVGFVLDFNPDKGKNDKIPINTLLFNNARSNDPGTWTTFDKAILAIGKRANYKVSRKSGNEYHTSPVDGIGIMFANGIFGVDLDHVINPDGSIDPAAQDIIDTIDSYTEYSPSGTGVHILCKGDIPPGERRAGIIEMYNAGRFFTVTGQTYGAAKMLEERTAQAAAVHAKYLKKSVEPPAAPLTVGASVKDIKPGRFQDDNSILQLAFNSRSGERIKALYGGDITAHSGSDRSQTGADLALCSDLVYWTNGEAAQVDRLFRSSGLMRPKWDAVHRPKDGATYGQMTIEKALQGFTPYTKQEYSVTIGLPSVDANNPEEPAAIDPLEAAAAYQQESTAGYIDQFFNGVADSVNTPVIPTGFIGLDKLLEGGLYEGLYIVGAISSLGKTTFVLQMADQIAAAGHDVIVFSLEMARTELMAKSISRLTFKLTQRRGNAKTTRGITAGKRYAGYSEIEIALIETAKEEYREKISGRVWIREGIGDLGVDTVRGAVKKHIAITGHRPIIVIDYLQILAPYDMRATDKQNTDKAVLELKRISRDYKLPVIGVSSFNRDNYTAPVNMAAFKESGAIEYSSDVLIGLQYQGMDYQEGEADGARQKRIRKLNKDNEKAARKGEGVEIQLQILKNRNGSKGTSDPLTFYSMFNAFIEHPEGFTVVDDEPKRPRL